MSPLSLGIILGYQAYPVSSIVYHIGSSLCVCRREWKRGNSLNTCTRTVFVLVDFPIRSLVIPWMSYSYIGYGRGKQVQLEWWWNVWNSTETNSRFCLNRTEPSQPQFSVTREVGFDVDLINDFTPSAALAPDHVGCPVLPTSCTCFLKAVPSNSSRKRPNCVMVRALHPDGLDTEGYFAKLSKEVSYDRFNTMKFSTIILPILVAAALREEVF